MRRNLLPRPDGRSEILAATRNFKMTKSPHRFVRGSTRRFYEWIARADRISFPEGPPVWICGDCHVGNIGPVADARGRITMQIRDLDQTVIGNPAHDLLRLALSLASAARGCDLPGNVTARMLEAMIDGYEFAFRTGFDDQADLPIPKAVERALRQSRTANWTSLAEDRIEGARPAIPLGRRYWPLSQEERQSIRELCEEGQLHRLATSLRGRHRDAAIELLDAAYWMKGCSSLGLLRYAIILSVRGQEGGPPEHCIIDIKEATKAVAPRASGARMPRDNGERVVEGARHLSPALGERMIATRFLGKSVFVRELLPQDLKLEVEDLTEKQAVKTARYLAAIVGKAHGAQMDTETRRSWLAQLQRNHSQTLEAPTWLWRAVVDLLGEHERAYLDHCRRNVMTARMAA